MSDTIENKVAQSGLITLDLEELKPAWDITGFDMASALYEGLVLREKDFREYIRTNDWQAWQGKHVYVHCSADAIVPTWAYMLLATVFTGVAATFIYGSRQDLLTHLWRQVINGLDADDYKDKRIVIKGCSKEEISEAIYMELTTKLLPVARSLMFGEPCSTVPLYKKK